MAITWRQHIKHTMARMEKGTHLKDVLKEASKTWKTVKKDSSEVVGDVVGKTHRARHHKRGHKGSKGRKHTRKHKKSHRRHRRGGSHPAPHGVLGAKVGGLSHKGVAANASPVSGKM
ncbi:MAG: hypothetical protein EBY20_07740 [Alphaproteobacteria bacterium]|nr:hypothetical protein [Alphaproteobacteria bacterium]